MFDPETSFRWRHFGTPHEIESAVRLLNRFESLGHDCEFGLVQRHLSLEPLGMFRWGGGHLEHLVKMLDADFAGMDLAENHRLQVIHGEYYFTNTSFSLSRHTHVKENSNPNVEKLMHKQLIVTSFFVRRFRELLESGERIFVFKDRDELSPRFALQLGKALRRHGPARLLMVHEHGRVNQDPALEQLDDDVWYGRVDLFGNQPHGWDVSLQSWLELLSRLIDEVDR